MRARGRGCVLHHIVTKKKTVYKTWSVKDETLLGIIIELLSIGLQLEILLYTQCTIIDFFITFIRRIGVTISLASYRVVTLSESKSCPTIRKIPLTCMRRGRKNFVEFRKAAI